MKISKALATQIAEKALAFRDEEINKAEQAVHVQCDLMAETFTPQAVKDLFMTERAYFNEADNPRFFTTESTDWTHYALSKSYPVRNGSYDQILVSEEALKALHKLTGRVSKLKAQLVKDIEALETAMYQLRTRDKVLKELPELEQYFPTEMSTALVPNMSGIRDLLKH